MESKLTKMMKLAPETADALDKINYITAIPEQSAGKVIAPVAVAAPLAAAAAGAAPKAVIQEAPVALVSKKIIDK